MFLMRAISPAHLILFLQSLQRKIRQLDGAGFSMKS